MAKTAPPFEKKGGSGLRVHSGQAPHIPHPCSPHKPLRDDHQSPHFTNEDTEFRELTDLPMRECWSSFPGFRPLGELQKAQMPRQERELRRLKEKPLGQASLVGAYPFPRLIDT